LEISPITVFEGIPSQAGNDGGENGDLTYAPGADELDVFWLSPFNICIMIRQ